MFSVPPKKIVVKKTEGNTENLNPGLVAIFCQKNFWSILVIIYFYFIKNITIFSIYFVDSEMVSGLKNIN